MTERDVPVLTRLLSDRDHVTQPSAANVLADLGDKGMRALRLALAPPDIRTCSVIEDALREADSPTYRPIRDYSLTAQEWSAFAAAGRPSSRSEPAHDQAAGADSRREAT